MMTMNRFLVLALLALNRIGVTLAFAPSHISSPKVKTELNVDTTGWDSFRDLKSLKDIPSGEQSRQYRRTVYSHDDWKKHRSQDRFFYYLAAIFKSGVYKNLTREVLATTSVATFVVLYNILVTGYTDFAGVAHGALINSPVFPKLGLPLAPFTLASPSLGLLLGKSRVLL